MSTHPLYQGFPVHIINQYPVGAMIIVGTGDKYHTFHNFNTDKSIKGVFKNDQRITGEEFPEGVDFGGVEDGEGAFQECGNLKGFHEGVTFKNLKNGKHMFQSCTKLTALPETAKLDALTNGQGMFEDCSNLKQLPESLGLVNLYNGQSMFQNCTSLRNVPPSINLKNLRLGVSMFAGCCLTAQSIKNILKSLPTTSETHNLNVGFTHNDSTTDPVDWRYDEEIAKLLNTSTPIDYATSKYFMMSNGWRIYIEN